MRLKIFAGLLLGISINCFAQPSFYSGFINGINPIKMRLEIQPVYATEDGEIFHKGYDLVGDYQYVKVGEKLKLEGKNRFIKPGKIARDSIVRIYEYVYLECTGYFEGKFHKDGSYRGMWHSVDGIRHFPFEVSLSQNAKIIYKENERFFYPQLKGLLSNSIEKSLNKKLCDYKSGYENKHTEGNQFQKHKYDFDILYNENSILSLLSTEEWYSDTTDDAFLAGTKGGFSSINLLTGKKLRYEDVLMKGSELRIDEFITDEIVELCDYFPDKLLLQEIRENICVTQMGLLFYYPGCPSQEKYGNEWAVEIPFRKIRKLINPNGLLKNY